MERLTPINEIERIISSLYEQKNYWKMRYKLNGDGDSCKYIAINDAAIKALEEKIKTISIGESEFKMESEQSDWYMSDFGDTVFMNYEDAKKALEEIDNK